MTLAAPLALYWYGLHGVEERPERPRQMASAPEQQRVWTQVRGRGPVTLDPMNPYGVTFNILAGRMTAPAGETLAFWIARTYLLDHRRDDGMSWWHLSSVALTIWISRNWSAEEVMTVASRTMPPDQRGLSVAPEKQEAR